MFSFKHFDLFEQRQDICLTVFLCTHLYTESHRITEAIHSQKHSKHQITFQTSTCSASPSFSKSRRSNKPKLHDYFYGTTEI